MEAKLAAHPYVLVIGDHFLICSCTQFHHLLLMIVVQLTMIMVVRVVVIMDGVIVCGA